MILKQRHFLTVRTFEFKTDGLLCKSKNLRSRYEIVVPYEYIYPDRLVKREETHWVPFVSTPILAMVFFINLFALINGEETEFTYGLLSIIFILMVMSALSAYLARTKEILISVVGKTSLPGHITFYDRQPSKSAVQEFLNELENKVNTYIKAKYTRIDLDYPVGPQLDNLSWLRNRKAISEEEFMALKDKVLNRSTKPIGFKSNT